MTAIKISSLEYYGSTPSLDQNREAHMEIESTTAPTEASPIHVKASLPGLQVKHSDKRSKKILFVTPEFADLVKVGGLGDVSAFLPRSLRSKHDVRILIPGYREVLGSGRKIRVIGNLPAHAGLPSCRLGRMDMEDGLVVYVVLCDLLYNREGTPYADGDGVDWPDNPIRFARLSLTAAVMAQGRAGSQWRPQLVHANDWPTALTAAYIEWQGGSTPSVFTIHNLSYQGVVDQHYQHKLGAPRKALNEAEMGFRQQLSLLKAGINYSSHITTVSSTYAREITSERRGCGLEDTLRSKFEKGKLTGIVNGINWDANSDPHLISGCGNLLGDGKARHRDYLFQRFGLQSGAGPLFSVVSRLVQQKGLDLTIDITDALLKMGGRLLVMGKGETEIEQRLMDLAARHPGKVSVYIGFDEREARRIFAGSDFLLMPSRFEPCGLSQLYAQRFAALPIATRTGGLADTIEDGINGFHFPEATSKSYRSALDRADRVYRSPELLRAMRHKAVASPPPWTDSAEHYDRLYQQLLTEPSANKASRGG